MRAVRAFATVSSLRSATNWSCRLLAYPRAPARSVRRLHAAIDTDGVEPISDAEFASELNWTGAASAQAPIVVGVSGGPDSIALLLLLNAWCNAQRLMFQYAPRLVAVTVDHALRVEAAAEAKAVGALCATLGVPHVIRRLDWGTDKPSLSHVQETARKRRYGALSDVCGALGAQHLFVAHTLQDQVETALLRWARSSGLSGLRVMRPESPLSPAPPDAPLVLVRRPLLRQPKLRLIATCRARGVPFALDPSNDNAAFDRVRVRQVAGFIEEATVARYTCAGANRGASDEELRVSGTGRPSAATLLVAATTHLARVGSLYDARVVLLSLDSFFGRAAAAAPVPAHLTRSPSFGDGAVDEGLRFSVLNRIIDLVDERAAMAGGRRPVDSDASNGTGHPRSAEALAKLEQQLKLRVWPLLRRIHELERAWVGGGAPPLRLQRAEAQVRDERFGRAMPGIQCVSGLYVGTVLPSQLRELWQRREEPHWLACRGDGAGMLDQSSRGDGAPVPDTPQSHCYAFFAAPPPASAPAQQPPITASRKSGAGSTGSRPKSLRDPPSGTR